MTELKKGGCEVFELSGIEPGFKPLGQKDIDKIFEMCL